MLEEMTLLYCSREPRGCLVLSYSSNCYGLVEPDNSSLCVCQGDRSLCQHAHTHTHTQCESSMVCVASLGLHVHKRSGSLEYA